MTVQPPVSLTEEEIAAVRSWVVFEDPHVLALAKPAGLSSQGGRIKAHTLDDLLWAFMRSNGKRPELVHRLHTSRQRARFEPEAARRWVIGR